MNPAPFQSLVHRLRSRADEQGNTIGYSFLVNGETIGDTLTYEELDQRSREIAVMLSRVVSPGDRVMLIYSPGLDFISAFFGCLNAGVIAVPVYPPQVARPQRSLPQLRSIALEAGISAVLCTEGLRDKLHTLFQDAAELARQPILATDYYGLEDIDSWQEPAIEADTVAFLQYTSGSTASPKGVVVSHGNIVHNLSYIQHRSEQSNTVQVSWLPTYHDMGLFSGVLFPLFIGRPSYLMPPVSFLQKPIRWLQAISRFKGTHSGGPNFSYQLCVDRITAEERNALDLSSWKVAYNGAEPIHKATLERFFETFVDCGFRRHAMFPVYGLAESTVFVSGAPWSQEKIETRLTDPENDLVVADETSREHVSCGSPCFETEVVIVDPTSMIPMPLGQIGEIWISGPSVALGYWNRPDAQRQTFAAHLAVNNHGPFLRTGDLGYTFHGELFVTGRIKDLIIIRGRKHYPQDIERTVESSHVAIRSQCSAAFSISTCGGERLAIVSEVDLPRNNDGSAQVIAAIREAIAEQHELQTHYVSLLRRNSIAKTSSGKIRRHAVRDAVVNGTLDSLDHWTLHDQDIMSATFSDQAAVYR